ncbi:Re/Si-specific NAD(P)(+) transhydrogenase subunit alpha [Helcobacillus massiliensis]|uniref:Re/Si-specific NAD(P)(+) transhydrogenase subunit alpha n=1 Tax=Helcobacillus massiliensis TaxID=521392 RepID=UPI0021A27AD4|nr:Re/Si-specific NAD(P)(+) transhydrogenase subunit alpha [Helcobacillus massiliensis]MCT1558380.1 Re/Si-specific NAD(P)(+) transhydrogenase subunit alpha [Helcobacillus massiliensis]MCT2036848.1 Re/Si-specific NAD(P)(+) transhydrogenase subunit alpha [Helcobacillus massiliensis]MCT2332629.1 Re/Si-specific NAD(P)(+) transhydrogenase subunit alpha [Helcobacillus massiliensis]
MRIGVPNEAAEGGTLVAATPATVKKLIGLGYEVAVQTRAGVPAAFPDTAYTDAGAHIVGDDVWTSDIVLALDAPRGDRITAMAPGSTLITRMAPGRSPELIDLLAERNITGLAVDAVPRISRAQSMDVLSSMANIAGYRAVVEAASRFGRLFTGQITAAGQMPPATVYVIGAGVAGLAAIGTANSMGAIVKATDLRPETAEQVESMGAEFVAIPAATEKSADGYAKEMTEDQARAAAKLYAEQSAQADIVITTANIPGRTAPILLTAADVAAMKPGSVIVDMAAANGGNCELTRPGEIHTTDGGVHIIGYTDLASRLPGQSSQLYGQNLVNLLALTTPGKDGQLTLDLEDEIVRSITVTQARPEPVGPADVLWPPPPVTVSAAPAPAPTPEPEPVDEQALAAEASRKRTLQRLWMSAAGILGAALVLASPLAVAQDYMVLLLAVVVGFYVITAVTHSLHTPLMSETNAVSGIVLVGAILQVGSSNIAVTILAFLAIVVASINIFGGFAVTHRMLAMFRTEA